jgi:hypothetical protein
MVEIVIEPYDSLPCALERFIINGIDADLSDFGETEDMDAANAEEYACENRQFVPEMPTDEVLAKYKINLADYKEICERLQCALAIGSCGWCV